MIDYKDRIAYYDRAFDAFNKANMDATIYHWQYAFGRVEHLVDLEKSIRIIIRGLCLTIPISKCLTI